MIAEVERDGLMDTTVHSMLGFFINPRRHRRVDATPLRFFWNIFFVYRSNVTIFSLAFRLSFLRPPGKFQDPDPLLFHL